METAARKRPIHLGDHVRRMRTALGVKQAALATELGTTQQNISRIEQEEEVDDVTLERIAKALGVSAEAIKNFREDGDMFHIEHMHDHASAGKGNFNQCTFNPLDKLIEVMDENKKLYERLLQSERDKVELLERIIKEK
ncbi:helix-turn-helix transcriptional regulator [uncultured Pontibacter sp.]|uniref:helix-turn-helix domain-containing protein n=1 Tax=uncultured Pontibacter sp. TaxID=453356 RepID=UPI002619A8FF|nr:helix-turn-helix transcriptional regulator [uncultured Pontibacter sp.]